MIERLELVVLDTNVIISALLFRDSIPRRALVKAFTKGKVLSSPTIRNELREVVSRPKFDRFMPRKDRLRAVEDIIGDMASVNIEEYVRICRDPKDNKFLDVALAGKADVLITGDADLLMLHPFRSTAILTAASYLAR